MKTDVAIVVPNWNGRDVIGACLKSLQKQSKRSKIYVVDNGSTDKSVDYVKNNFPDIDLIALPKNHGFAGGVNAGIKTVLDEKFKYVALFNNDAVADKDWLRELVVRLDKDAGAGIATGKLLKEDRKHIDSTGEFCAKNGMPSPRDRDALDENQRSKVEQVFAATGGASLYRIAMLKKIGLFDERFFAYFEDVDLAFRAQLQSWGVTYTPKAIAYHRIGHTSSKIRGFVRYHSVKNYLYMYLKNMPTKLYWKYLPLHLWKLLRMMAGSIRDKQFVTFLRALLSFVLFLPATLHKRHEIQSSRTASSKKIDSLLRRSS